MKADRTG